MVLALLLILRRAPGGYRGVSYCRSRQLVKYVSIFHMSCAPQPTADTRWSTVDSPMRLKSEPSQILATERAYAVLGAFCDTRAARICLDVVLILESGRRDSRRQKFHTAGDLRVRRLFIWSVHE